MFWGYLLLFLPVQIIKSKKISRLNRLIYCEMIFTFVFLKLTCINNYKWFDENALWSECRSYLQLFSYNDWYNNQSNRYVNKNINTNINQQDIAKDKNPKLPKDFFETVIDCEVKLKQKFNIKVFQKIGQLLFKSNWILRK